MSDPEVLVCACVCARVCVWVMLNVGKRHMLPVWPCTPDTSHTLALVTS